MKDIVRFIEVKCDNDKLIEAINIINTTRRYAFTNDSDLVYVYNKIKNYPLVIKTGYNNIFNEL